MDSWGNVSGATAALALVVLAGAFGAALAHSSQRAAGTSGIGPAAVLAAVDDSSSFCQAHELIPHKTAAVRVSMQTPGAAPPPLSVTLYRSDGRVIANGTLPSRPWRGTSVTVPVRPVTRGDAWGRVCFGIGRGDQIAIVGEPAPPRLAARPLSGRVRIDYLRPGHESLLTLAPTVARRLGLAQAWSGPSVALVTLALVCAVVLFTLWHLRRLAP
jgi:hypothetical protein